MNNIMLKYICEHGKCWVFQFLCSKWRNWSTCHDGSWPLRTLIRCKSLVDSLRRYEWRKTLYRSQRPARPSYIAKFVSYLVVIRWYRNLCFSPDSIGALLVLLGCVSFGPFASSLDGTFSSLIQSSATSLANGSFGLGLANRAWTESSTVRICNAGDQLVFKTSRHIRPSLSIFGWYILVKNLTLGASIG